MKKTSLRSLIGVALVSTMGIATSAPLLADTIKVDMKPGLWEHRIKLVGGDSAAAQAQQMQGAMDEVKKQMENLPPEQRKMMEDMMAQQGMKFSDQGVSMQNNKVQIGKDGTVVKQCVTQEQIDKGYMPESTADCNPTITKLSGTKFKMVYACKDKSATQGEGEIEFTSSTAYKGKAHFVNKEGGTTQRYDTEQSGSWLSSNCGDIKPEAY
jgi:hypothetical protein